MLKYCLDISPKSYTNVFTADESARSFPLYIVELGHFYAHQGYFTRRDGKMSALLMYTRAGNGVLHWKNQVCNLYPGTAVVIYCDTFHQYYTGDSGEWDFLWVHMDGMGLKGFAAPLMDRLTPIRLHSVREMEEAFKRLESMKSSLGIVTQAETSHILNAMLLNMLKNLHKTDQKDVNGHSEVRLLTEYIHEHLSEDIGMAEFEKLTHFSKYYLIHIFRQQIGVPPYRYLHQCRIQRAQELLRTTDDTVSAVGAKVGYMNPVSFIRHFQSILGTTPARYRKESIHLCLKTVP